ncbi:MAG: zinc-binding alcohol dehydrogenase, partial [Candidatus Aminicenantes bacterium]|nr:zinc-binding alcohol dehydrogenase [Candidatus Aminicenantes bacterium]
MQQLTHNQKKPVIQLLDVPFPVLGRGQVLVRNHYSVITCPEEEQQSKEARSGVIARARTRKKEVKQVIEQIKKSGLADTYHMVMNRFQVPVPLGNCCSGEVIAVSSEINDIKIGDRVACGGEGAWHADVVAVNRNLCVKIPEGVDLKQAAFAAIAAITIQGVRQADVRLGENVVVIGLGLLGQLTIQLLQAAGIHTVGIDIDQAQVLSSKKIGADLALNRNHEDLERLVSGFTDGHGADAVIITANSRSTDPVNLAGMLCRHKGKVVVVGEIPTGFDREHYYKKELDLRMSSSYGPGRHDPVYEERGIDYPIGYVRWTENRNMQAF